MAHSVVCGIQALWVSQVPLTRFDGMEMSKQSDSCGLPCRANGPDAVRALPAQQRVPPDPLRPGTMWKPHLPPPPLWISRRMWSTRSAASSCPASLFSLQARPPASQACLHLTSPRNIADASPSLLAAVIGVRRLIASHHRTGAEGLLVALQETQREVCSYSARPWPSRRS